MNLCSSSSREWNVNSRTYIQICEIIFISSSQDCIFCDSQFSITSISIDRVCSSSSKFTSSWIKFSHFDLSNFSIDCCDFCKWNHIDIKLVLFNNYLSFFIQHHIVDCIIIHSCCSSFIHKITVVESYISSRYFNIQSSDRFHEQSIISIVV